MRNIALIVFGFLLLTAQTCLATVLPLYPWWPSLLLPVVIYLGVSQEVHLVRGAGLSFVLGYLTDSFCGSPMGLETFVLVATFMLSRGVRLRLVLRGPFFQVLMTFAITLLAGGTQLAIRAIFVRTEPFPLTEVQPALFAALAPAITTALASPFLFLATQRIEGLAGRHRDEEAVV